MRNRQWQYIHLRIVLFFIRFYQKTISFDHGLLKFMYPNGYCRFYPTCSEYAAQAVRKKGLIKGSALVFRRILRCNPFSEGGIDHVD